MGNEFPLDTQTLKITFEVLEQNNSSSGSLHVIPDGKSIVKGFALEDSFMLSPTVKEHVEEVYGWETVYVEMKVTRLTKFYIFNYMVPMSLLCSLFAVLAIDPTEVADRLNLVLTVLLT